MAFLDFIKNRMGQQPSAEQQTQSPETAKQMYNRQAVEEKTAAKPSDLTRPEQKAELTEAKALYDKASQESPSPTPPPSPSPAGGATNPQPMQQPMMGQDTVAPELSPTSAQAASRAKDVEGPTPPSPTPPPQPQTVPRPAPSWER